MKSYFAIVLAIFILLSTACGGSDDSTSTNQEALNNSTESPTVEPEDNVNTNNANSDDPVDNNAETEDVAAIVNGEVITRTMLETEVTWLFENSGAASIDTFRNVVLDGLIDQTLIQQFAAANAITIEDDAIQAEMAALESEATTAGFSLPALFGLPEDVETAIIEQKVYESLLSQAVEQYVFDNSELDSTQVRARHILVRDESTAQTVLQRLQEGEDFATLAAEYSKDLSTAQAGGDLGWVARGDLLQSEVEAVIFSLDPGFRYPEPVQSALGWHVIEVLDRDDTLALTELQIAQQRVQIFQSWLIQQRENADIQRFIS